MNKNYQLERTIGNMKRNSVIGHSLSLEKKEAAVRNIMEEQKISVDPSKLAGYKKEKFLKAIDNKIGLGYYDKKAFHSAYDGQKDESLKTKVNPKPQAGLSRDRYEEIMANRKEPIQDSSRRTFMPSIVDDSKLRSTSNIAKIVGLANVGKVTVGKKEMKDRLAGIQS